MFPFLVYKNNKKSTLNVLNSLKDLCFFLAWAHLCGTSMPHCCAPYFYDSYDSIPLGYTT